MGFFLLIVCPIIIFLIFKKTEEWFAEIDATANSVTGYTELFHLKLAGYDMNSIEVKELQKKKKQISTLYSITKHLLAYGCIGLFVGVIRVDWIAGVLTALVFWSPSAICLFKCKRLVKECAELHKHITAKLDLITMKSE